MQHPGHVSGPPTPSVLPEHPGVSVSGCWVGLCRAGFSPPGAAGASPEEGMGKYRGWVDAAGSGSLKINLSGGEGCAGVSPVHALFFPSFRANPESKEHPAPQATEAPPAPWVPPVSQVLLASLGAR